MSFVTPRYEEGRPAPENLWCTATTIEDLTSLDIHVHPGVEVGVVLEGEEEIQFSGFTLRCGPGNVWLSNAWEPHGWRISRPRTRIAVAVFTPEFMGDELVGGASWLAPFTVPPQLRPAGVSAEARRQVVAIGHDLAREIAARQEWWEEAVRFSLLRLLVALARDWEYRELPNLGAQRDIAAHDLSRLMPALATIHASPWQTVRAREAAAACGLSVSYFRGLFRQVTGTSFARFCLNSRLSYTAHQLLHTSRPVAAIAAEVGFVDASHLHHRFIEEFGCTPAQFRRRRGVVLPRAASGAAPLSRARMQPASPRRRAGAPGPPGG